MESGALNAGRRSLHALLRLGIAIALVVVSSIALVSPDRSAAAIAPTVRNAVVLVARRNPAESKYVPIGTAFHIGGGWFRTAAHVATYALPRRYEGKGFDDWALYQADEFGNPSQWLAQFDVACVDRRWQGKGEETVFPHDSALLRATMTSPPDDLMESSRQRAWPGEAVSVWGFPQGRVLFESRANVTGVSDQWIRLREQVGSPTIGGHSGSPVLDGAGKVVGVMVGGVTGVGESGIAVAITDAEEGCPKP